MAIFDANACLQRLVYQRFIEKGLMKRGVYLIVFRLLLAAATLIFVFFFFRSAKIDKVLDKMAPIMF